LRPTWWGLHLKGIDGLGAQLNGTALA
jgi:hypothetical protein